MPGLTIDQIVVLRRTYAYTPNGVSLYAEWLLLRAKFVEYPSVLKNSLRVRFNPRLGTKYADSGALPARFVVAMSSVLTFSTGCDGLAAKKRIFGTSP